MQPLAHHVLVSGLVQGVCYRWETANRAQRLGVNGWIRNLRDGRVEALLCGAPEQVDALIAWMHAGPPGARVEQLCAEPRACDAPPDDFQILPSTSA